MGEKDRKLGKMKSGERTLLAVFISLFLFFICYLLLLHRYGNLVYFLLVENSLLQDILREI